MHVAIIVNWTPTLNQCRVCDINLHTFMADCQHVIIIIIVITALNHHTVHCADLDSW